MIGAFVPFPKDTSTTGWVIQETGCWEWVGHRDMGGYGRLGHRKTSPGGELAAHRVCVICRNAYQQAYRIKTRKVTP